MKRLSPRYSSLPLLGVLLLPSWSAFAQGSLPASPASSDAPVEITPAPTSTDATITPSASEVPAPSVSASQGPIFVTVSVTGYAVGAADVAAAIARELDVALSSVPEAARATFEVVVTRDKDLTITYRDYNGHALQRVVKAPANDAQVTEVAALLAVNLYQDKANEILSQLTPAPAPTPAIPPTAEEAQPAVAEPHLPLAPINGTVAYPLSVVPDVDRRSVGFELGLFYSRVGAVRGFALNPLVLHVVHATEGVSIAGLGTVSGNDASPAAQQGLRISGLFNYGKGPFEGVGIAGLIDYEHVGAKAVRGIEGVQIGGVFSGVDAGVEGAQIAGVVTYSRSLEGMQIAGLSSVARGAAEGGQIAGVVTYADGISGTQIAGLANVTTKRLEGAQIAGAVNVAGDVQGAQIGLVNIGKRVTGAQVGIINVAEEVDGASIGVVTYSKKGQTQLTAWFDPTRPVNVGARFVSGALYAMPMVGGDPSKVEEFAFGFGLGARIPVDRLYFDLEGSSTNEFKDGSVDESALDLRYRTAIGFQVAPWLGVFAGGGVRHQFHAKDGGEHRVRGIWNIGVDLF